MNTIYRQIDRQIDRCKIELNIVLRRKNGTTMNLLLKVSRFFTTKRFLEETLESWPEWDLNA